MDLARGWSPRHRHAPRCFAELRRPGPFHVGVLLENTPEYLFLLAGAALAGAAVVGLNPTRRGDELAGDLHHTDCQLVITDSTQLAPSRRGRPGAGSASDRLLIADSAARTSPRSSEHADVRLPSAMPDPDDLFMLIFTSGSTGPPKAVRMTQGRAARSAARVPFSSDDVLYSAMPLFHGNALNAAVFPAWACGSTIALRRKFSASGFLPDIREIGRHVLQHGRTGDRPHRGHRTDRAATATTRSSTCSAPRPSEPDKVEFTRRFGVPLFEGYGSSENTVILLPRPDIPGRSGRPRRARTSRSCRPTASSVHGPEFDDDGRLLNAAEAIGEIVGRNVAGRFEGYYNNADGRGRADPQRLVLVGRPGLPRRRRRLLLRRTVG